MERVTYTIRSGTEKERDLMISNALKRKDHEFVSKGYQALNPVRPVYWAKMSMPRPKK